ncbi:MAG: 3'(2'),5'-bisphosphate nucleotidase CysQ [Raineya sp.]|jgi:3'(2'), 5'-bisphosphate nucleotidase|nr:3'(2'),5'-bisphosphate nucleotidase CysQ [Raineya sp.]
MYNLETILETMRLASEEIMKIYSQDFQITQKQDSSPLTQADQISHQIITEFLEEHTPKIPIISEEDDLPDYNTRKKWKYFWLLDPLDGTKEFIDKNGEFTVNLALMQGTEPILGIIQVPASDTVYWAEKGKGAFKREKLTQKIQVRKNVSTADIVAAVSRSHLAPEDKKMLDKHKIKKTIAMGSALKFCLVAEGKADFYYRYNPTMEWDTAAGQILVEEAGGVVLDEHGKTFGYNKTTLLNGSFLCKSF